MILFETTDLEMYGNTVTAVIFSLTTRAKKRQAMPGVFLQTFSEYAGWNASRASAQASIGTRLCLRAVWQDIEIEEPFQSEAG